MCQLLASKIHGKKIATNQQKNISGHLRLGLITMAIHALHEIT